jgi:hypothetical protein
MACTGSHGQRRLADSRGTPPARGIGGAGSLEPGLVSGAEKAGFHLFNAPLRLSFPTIPKLAGLIGQRAVVGAGSSEWGWVGERGDRSFDGITARIGSLREGAQAIACLQTEVDGGVLIASQ